MRHVEQETLMHLARADTFQLLADALGASPPVGGSAPAADDLRCVTERAWGADVALSSRLADWSGVAARTPDEVVRRERTRLFAGSAPCPTDETAFVRRDKGAVIGDVCGFYRAFGFSATEGIAEKPDSIVHELEFLAALHVMLAAAMSRGEGHRVEVVRGAVSAFVDDHLGDWVRPFARRLREVTSERYFAELATALERSVELLMGSFGLGPPREPGPLGEEPGTPYECGMAEQERVVALTAEGRELGGD